MENQLILFFFSSRRRHTRSTRDWSSDVCSSDLVVTAPAVGAIRPPSEVRRVGEHRVDDERPTGVIHGHLEADPIDAFAYVAAGDVAPDSVYVLVDDRLVLTYVSSGRVQHELAPRFDLEFVRAPET